MPILDKDIDVFPEDLLWQRPSGVPDQCWFGLYTKPRQEKALTRRLHAMGKSFCGLLAPNEIRTPAGRKKISHLPLFPGYVFLFGSDVDRYDAVCTNRVIDVLIVNDGERLRDDLLKIHTAISSGCRVTRVNRLEEGQQVRVVSGPLVGQTGFYVKKKSQSRLILSLSFINQAASVEIDEQLVEPV